MTSAASSQHDPYWEVEKYLQKAQDEIGKAIDDLLHFDHSHSHGYRRHPGQPPARMPCCWDQRPSYWMHFRGSRDRRGSWTPSSSKENIGDDVRWPTMKVDMDLLSIWAETFAKQMNRGVESSGSEDESSVARADPRSAWPHQGTGKPVAATHAEAQYDVRHDRRSSCPSRWCATDRNSNTVGGWRISCPPCRRRWSPSSKFLVQDILVSARDTAVPTVNSQVQSLGPLPSRCKTSGTRAVTASGMDLQVSSHAHDYATDKNTVAALRNGDALASSNFVVSEQSCPDRTTLYCQINPRSRHVLEGAVAATPTDSGKPLPLLLGTNKRASDAPESTKTYRAEYNGESQVSVAKTGVTVVPLSGVKSSSSWQHGVSSESRDLCITAEDSDVSSDSEFHSAEESVWQEEIKIHEEQLSGNKFVNACQTSTSVDFAFPTVKPVAECVRSKDDSVEMLPRHLGFPVPLRAGLSPVCAASHMSRHELESFMRKVESSAYQPPPDGPTSCSTPSCRTDADSSSGGVDGPNQDAVTQTSPVLSRSSSTAWTTPPECHKADPTSKSRGESLSNGCPETPEGNASPMQSGPGTSVPPLQLQIPCKGFCSSSLIESDSSLSLSSACSVLSSSSEKSTQGQKLPSDFCHFVWCSGTQIIPLASPKTPTGLQKGGRSVSRDTSRTLPEIDIGSQRGVKEDGSRERVTMRNPSPMSSSAPVLKVQRHFSVDESLRNRRDLSACGDVFGHPGEDKVLVPPRSQSVKELTELESLEACSWLRATGFPQYAQMYEDNLFPIDICSVQKDHEFLDNDAIHALFRRLNTLNRCARMKIDSMARKSAQTEDSDEEESCALSENWQFQRSSRRWSRIAPPLNVVLGAGNPCARKLSAAPASPTWRLLHPEDACNCSNDSVFADDRHSSPESGHRVLSTSTEEDLHIFPSPVPMEEEDLRVRGSDSGGSLSCSSEDKSRDPSELGTSSLRRTGSERLKESAKALLKRVESLKGKRKKKAGRQSSVAGSPPCVLEVAGESGPGAVADGRASQAYSSHFPRASSGAPDDSTQSDLSDHSQNETPRLPHRKKRWFVLGRGDQDLNVHSDSECSSPPMTRLHKDANSNISKIVEQFSPPQYGNGLSHLEKLSKKSGSCKFQGSWVAQMQALAESQPAILTDSSASREGEERISLYDNVPPPSMVLNRTCTESEEGDLHEKDATGKGHDSSDQDQDSGSLLSTSGGNSDQEMPATVREGERRDSGVGSSLTRPSPGSPNLSVRWHCFPANHRLSCVGRRLSSPQGMQLNALSAVQLMILRKLSLLKLTALMEKYSPSSRIGWNWGVPKFIRRIRAPDYKDKTVFGIPLLLVLQRTGQPLPPSIQAAMRHLRKTALESVGLFRKSGVRSRIQKLRYLNETSPGDVDYESQQAYDIADMLKQYFRELPEALLTNKLSETFISIFQYIPEDLRLEAVQAAVILLPDENYEVLQTLLAFLQEVCQHSAVNQMTPTNLSVCFAPSLFHLNTPRSTSASPRRRKTVGVPDQRELNENRAAHECLNHMIVNYKYLFVVSDDSLIQCCLPQLEQSEPATLEELGRGSNRGFSGWKAYIDGCIQALLKESREKFKGWITVPYSDSTELMYRKVCDGHPLRLWRVSVEVEAPPFEVLNRILRERHIWDDTLLKWRVVARLEDQSEVFQYVISSLPPHPPRDYCVLRSWKTDLPKGTCILVETSVDYPDALILYGGIRAVVLASRYLVEPCGAGKSRVTHVSRIDMRGKSPEWYNKAHGHVIALLAGRLRDSFKHGTEGPETKV